MADLAKIQTKVRRLTRSVSESQLTTTQLNEYINDFMLYDMPERLRTFSLRKKFTFYTQPNIDSYTTDTTTELADFKQKYLTVHPPFYVAGYQAEYTQSREIFYAAFPQIQQLISIGTGNGVLTNFSGTLSSIPLLRNQVLFTAVTSTNVGLRLLDNGLGSLTGDIGAASTINYLTGAYNITFISAPAAGTTVYAQVYTYVAGRPTSILFFDDTFVIRPVPDNVYAINFEVNARPTALVLAADKPDLWENWDYIAHGAAKAIFEDRGDVDSISNIEPRFVELEYLALRRTEEQNLDQRAATIFNAGPYVNDRFDPFNRLG